MSTIVMSACWRIQIPPTPKAVLMSLADNANDHGECWPSLTTIAMRTCFGRTAVIEAIRWLEEHGLLEADRSNGRHTRYTVKPSGLRPELFQNEGDQSASRTSPRGAPVRQADGVEGKPVRQPDQSARRTGSPGGLNQSASRTGPVRQADTNRQEPSRTKREDRAPTGTRLPPKWEPSAEEREFAQRERPDLDLAGELAKFRDHWAACPGRAGVKADWSATWRNWIRRADPPRAGAVPPPAAPAAPRDWRATTETPLENDLAYIRHQHAMGAYGEGPDADRERDARLEAARQRHGGKLEAEPA